MFFRKRRRFIYIKPILYIGDSMVYVLFDSKGNAIVFKTDSELEQYLKSHEGIYYLVQKYWKQVYVSEIYSRNGEYEKVTEKHVDMLD
jgi:predicted DNA-binding protein (MmcQ/YjbR family)